jgi:hypothetical protein
MVFSVHFLFTIKIYTWSPGAWTIIGIVPFQNAQKGDPLMTLRHHNRIYFFLKFYDMKSLRNVFDEKTNMNTTERVVSGLVGLTLLTMGIRVLKDTSPRKWILFTSSALLFFRGITGFSPVRSLF